MIRAKHHFFIYPFFQWFTLFLLKRKFHRIKIIGAFIDESKPILVIANHISWWDGFWLEYINLKMLHRKFHFMMLEEQLRKHWYFNYTGGYSVKKNSKSIMETLNYTSELLNVTSNMVFIFPQGKINSMHNHQIQFERGVDRIIKNCSREVQILFVANFIEYLSNSKPSLYMYIKSADKSIPDFQLLENEYNAFYHSALQNQQLISDQ